MGSDLFRLDGKVIVVTGGLGQLGRRFTALLRNQGASVAVLDVVEPDARTASTTDPNIIYIRCDITSRADIERALQAITSRWETPHGLVNNAALDSPPTAPIEENGPFETYPESSWDKVMQVNAKGPFLLCQVIGGAMAKAGRGSIVNVSSIYGVVSPNQALYEYRRQQGEQFFKPVAYSASKSALLNFTRYLATYWGGQNVRVNTMVLGGVFNNQDPRFVKEYAARVPLGRMANADEYNGSVVYLLSDASSYMTGASLVVDGGWTAW